MTKAKSVRCTPVIQIDFAGLAAKENKEGLSCISSHPDTNQETMPRKRYYIFILSMLAGLLISGIHPYDHFTWILEVFPAIIVLLIICFTDKTFPLSNLLLMLIGIHSFILFTGGHYTYARVPLFDTIKEYFHQSRNNYDKVGHFTQGFVPAIAAREILIRKQVIRRRKWLPFICVSICLAISALYELLETAVALLTGSSADDFLGTQGFVWDTQTDMFYALLGAVSALILLSRIHDASMKKSGVATHIEQ